MSALFLTNCQFGADAHCQSDVLPKDGKSPLSSCGGGGGPTLFSILGIRIALPTAGPTPSRLFATWLVA
jgi:hypothetical protein